MRPDTSGAGVSKRHACHLPVKLGKLGSCRKKLLHHAVLDRLLLGDQPSRVTIRSSTSVSREDDLELLWSCCGTRSKSRRDATRTYLRLPRMRVRLSRRSYRTHRTPDALMKSTLAPELYTRASPPAVNVWPTITLGNSCKRFADPTAHLPYATTRSSCFHHELRSWTDRMSTNTLSSICELTIVNISYDAEPRTSRIPVLRTGGLENRSPITTSPNSPTSYVFQVLRHCLGHRNPMSLRCEATVASSFDKSRCRPRQPSRRTAVAEFWVRATSARVSELTSPAMRRVIAVVPLVARRAS